MLSDAWTRSTRCESGACVNVRTHGTTITTSPEAWTKFLGAIPARR